jgi:gliding motility-associated-like protein
MKRILFLFLILFNCAVNAQLVVDNSSLTPQQLVQSVVVGQGINVSNIKFNGSTVNANTVSDQVGLFTNGATTTIGIDKGILLSTGNSAISIGPNDRDLATLPTSNPFVGDNDLYILSNNQVIKNVAILEFDFVPVGNKLSFNFVFASEEYPEFVNDSYNDNFGFFLSGPGITGPFSGGAKNIALIPSTILPVSINNLNNGNSNTGPCEYCSYYVNNEGGASIQYDGFTTVLAANSDVQCGQTYHIKLAIANVGDNNYDSAVFIEGASFSSTGINLGSDIKLCSVTDYTLKTGLNTNEIHEWRKDGIVIPTETGPNLLVTQTGTYSVKAFPFGVSCPVSDEIKVEFNTVKTPLISCGVKTANSIQFNWGALTDATAYSVSYQVGSTIVNIGSIGNTTTYTVNGLNPGENVIITITPIGVPVDCFTSGSQSCSLTPCVNSPITPTFTAIAPICEGTILSPLPIQSNNNITGSWSPVLNNTATTEYTFTPNAGQCSTQSKLTITINPIITPTFTAITPICEGTILSPLPIQSTNNITGSWSPVLNNTATTEYTFTPDAGQCAAQSKLTITVNSIITPTFTAITPICEGTILSPLPIQSTNNITGSWSPVLNNTATTEYTFTPDAGQCAAQSKLTIRVNPKPIPLLDNGIICIDKNTNAIIQSYILDSKLNSASYNFEWFLNGNKINNAIESTLEVTEKGTYAVIATNKITNCNSKIVQATVTETFSNSTVIEITQTNAFSNDATVTISIVQGTGKYEYQLDQGQFQSSNVFNEVPAGTHTINIIDTYGCTDLSQEIVIVGYQKFFTPNGDGHNDTWNIIGFSSQSNPIIYIFDRYGKLLKQINSADLGWDGNYNGYQMPATDYWFKITYIEDGINKEFKSHFSLKR